MMMEEMFTKLAAYDINCRTYEGHFLVTLKFDDNWTVFEPTDERVQCRLYHDRYIYCAPVLDGGLDAIFKAIQDTVNYNEDAERKMELFQRKTEELSRIFIDNPYEKLKDITFTFQKKPKKKRLQTAPDAAQTDADEKVEENYKEEPSKEETAPKEAVAATEEKGETAKEEDAAPAVPNDGCGAFLRRNGYGDEGDGFDEIEVPEGGLEI